jgi:hypothetical protein
MSPTQKWSARSLSDNLDEPLQGQLCATVWPTRSLSSTSRWFDELYLWTEGFEPSPRERSRIQLLGLKRAFSLLEREEADQVAVTLSFGTVERFTERIETELLRHELVAHRLVLLLRGSIENAASRYRLRAFADHLRSRQIPVGLRVTSPRLTMELKTFDLIAPDFAKVLAPSSPHADAWHNLALEARVVGVAEQWIIAAGLETQAQVDLATQAGFGFGQGNAIRPPQPLPDIPAAQLPAAMKDDGTSEEQGADTAAPDTVTPDTRAGEPGASEATPAEN